MANKGEVNLTLKVDDDGSVTVKQFTDKAEKNIKSLSETVANKLGSAFTKMGSIARSALNGVGGFLFSLKGAIAGLGLGMLVKDTIDVAAGFDKMKLSLDTVTQGEGEEWFKRLNDWALKMPINTEKAIQSFIMMRAMGLKPTIDQMTTLVDTTSALGGEADMLEGIARALGQIQTKGKVSAEELMQLAERGVPVFEILKQKFGDVETSTLDAAQAIEAIFAGLEERFGGQSAKIQNTWSGLVESLKSYWKEFQRLLMENGVMDYLEEKLASIVAWIDEMAANGQLQEWAADIADKITSAFNTIQEKSEATYQWIKKNWEGISAVFNFMWTIVKGLAKAFETLARIIGETIAKFTIAYEKFASGQILGGFSELGSAFNNLNPMNGIETLRGLDSYATGTPYVPRTGLYQLHEGERVVTKEENRNYSSNHTVNVGGITINVNGGANAEKLADELDYALAQKYKYGRSHLANAMGAA